MATVENGFEDSSINVSPSPQLTTLVLLSPLVLNFPYDNVEVTVFYVVCLICRRPLRCEEVADNGQYVNSDVQSVSTQYLATMYSQPSKLPQQLDCFFTKQTPTKPTLSLLLLGPLLLCGSPRTAMLYIVKAVELPCF